MQNFLILFDYMTHFVGNLPVTVSFTLLLLLDIWKADSVIFCAVVPLFYGKWGRRVTHVQVGPKNDCFSELITLQQLMARRCMICQKFPYLSIKMYKTRMSMKLNIVSIVCINIQCIWNYAEFDNSAWVLPNFSLKQTVKVTIKVISMCCYSWRNSIWHPSRWWPLSVF